MGISEMLHWWNLIYIAPLLVSLIWIVATVLTGAHGGTLSHGGHGIGHGLSHHGVDHLAGHATHIGHASHAEGAHSVHIGHHAHEHPHADEDSFVGRLLGILGIGQVPITLIFGVFALCWGAFGMVFNQIFGVVVSNPVIHIWPSLALTFVVSSFVTRSMAAILARMLPPTETYGVSRMELIGLTGKTIYNTTDSTGTVDISDVYGTVHRVQAKTEPGKEAIPSNSQVIAIDFDEADKRFVVRKDLSQ